jgi:hypothetical protein
MIHVPVALSYVEKVAGHDRRANASSLRVIANAQPFFLGNQKEGNDVL